MRGSGIDRLLWRDLRTAEQLHAVGIYAQPTDDAVHRGDPDVVVSQGNHFVSLKSNGQPDPAFELEVLHLPWRSWRQYERRVVNTGRSYEANPDLRPSKNHHGMADYRRHLAGRLPYAFLVRLPLERDLVGGAADGDFVRDTWLRDQLHGLLDRALLPDLLARCLDASRDEPIDPAEHERDADLGRLFIALERERDEARRLADRPPPQTAAVSERAGSASPGGRREPVRRRRSDDASRAESRIMDVRPVATVVDRDMREPASARSIHSARARSALTHRPPERHELREMLFGTRERFGYLRCLGCGTMRIATRPGRPGAATTRPTTTRRAAGEPAKPAPRRLGHPSPPIAGAIRDRAILLSRRRRTRALDAALGARPVAADVQRASGFTRRAGLHSFDDPILDVGCGRRATHLANLEEVGFRDSSASTRSWKATASSRASRSGGDRIEEQSGTFQAITFHHSFEHVPDPEATLIAASRRLRPGGVVLIRTPVMGTWFWESSGRPGGSSIRHGTCGSTPRPAWSSLPGERAWRSWTSSGI